MSWGPLLIEGPKDNFGSASPDIRIIDLQPLNASVADETTEPGSADDAGASDTVPPEHGSGWRLSRHAPLAAALAFAVALGAVAGAAATSSLIRPPAPNPTTAVIAAAAANRALQDSVAQLGNELATLKAGIVSAQRSTATQLGKLTEHLDRVDKAQAEPTAKLARLQDGIDRLEHRQQQVAAVAPAPSPDITGSVAPPKEEAKPPVAEGWRLRDFYAGRAVVQSRNGSLFEVGPGSNLPGLGKVETVKRENGQVVVTARNGVIAGSFEQRRPPYYLPYRY
jgi:hypothetical protein